MNIIKGKGQRLIPEELLKYLEAYKKAHPDPTTGGGATLDDIVDSHGNKRFIEGDLTFSLSPTSQTELGATVKYSKWSLSGTHLMIVGVVSFTNGTSQGGSIEIFKVNLPDWLKAKLVPIFSTYLISRIESPKYPTGTVSAELYLFNNEIVMHLVNLTTQPLTNNCTVRYQFDLLIDSE